MKKYRLTYDEWKCITKKQQKIQFVSNDKFCGYTGILDIEEVTEPQVWNFNGKDRIVCDKGIKWISILPKDKYYFMYDGRIDAKEMKGNHAGITKDEMLIPIIKIGGNK